MVVPYEHPLSPFARKGKIAVAERQLGGRPWLNGLSLQRGLRYLDLSETAPLVFFTAAAGAWIVAASNHGFSPSVDYHITVSATD